MARAWRWAARMRLRDIGGTWARGSAVQRNEDKRRQLIVCIEKQNANLAMSCFRVSAPAGVPVSVPALSLFSCVLGCVAALGLSVRREKGRGHIIILPGPFPEKPRRRLCGAATGLSYYQDLPSAVQRFAGGWAQGAALQAPPGYGGLPAGGQPMKMRFWGVDCVISVTDSSQSIPRTLYQSGL